MKRDACGGRLKLRLLIAMGADVEFAVLTIEYAEIVLFTASGNVRLLNAGHCAVVRK